MLCVCCDQFHCNGCGQTFCVEHLVSVGDDSETPLRWRGPCAAECEPVRLPAPIPLQAEVWAPSHLEADRGAHARVGTS